MNNYCNHYIQDRKLHIIISSIIFIALLIFLITYTIDIMSIDFSKISKGKRIEYYFNFLANLLLVIGTGLYLGYYCGLWIGPQD